MKKHLAMTVLVASLVIPMAAHVNAALVFKNDSYSPGGGVFSFQVAL